MLTTSEIESLYDTILTTPGMNETVKIHLNLSRKNVLLLNKVIERGLNPSVDGKSKEMLNVISPDALEQLKMFADDCLDKAGLKELNEKLRSFK